jgi:hypothetical protein
MQDMTAIRQGTSGIQISETVKETMIIGRSKHFTVLA